MSDQILQNRVIEEWIRSLPLPTPWSFVPSTTPGDNVVITSSIFPTCLFVIIWPDYVAIYHQVRSSKRSLPFVDPDFFVKFHDGLLSVLNEVACENAQYG